MLRQNFLKQYSLIIIALFSCSCGQSENYKMIVSKVSHHQILIDTSYVEIKIDSNKHLFEYKASSSTDNGIFCGFNPNSNSLDFFDLFAGRELAQTKVRSNKRDAIKGCAIINPDSILLLSSEKILLVNKVGEIKKDIPINETSKDLFFKTNYIFEPERAKNFQYIPSINKIIATSLSSKGSEHKNAFNLSPVTQISIEDKPVFKSIPLSWSNLYKENFYGFFIKSFVSFDGSNIITSFPIEPNIYVHNIKNKKDTVFGGYPNFKNVKSPLAEPLDIKDHFNDDKKLKNYLESISYGKVIPSVKGEMYFRVMSMGLSGKDRENHDFQKRKLYLIIYDNNFDIVKTLSLNDQSYVVEGAFATEKGLFFPCPNSAGTLRFKLFTFKIT